MVSHINTEVPVPRSSPVVSGSEVDVMDVGCWYLQPAALGRLQAGPAWPGLGELPDIEM